MDRDTFVAQARTGRISSLYEVSLDQITWRRLRDWQELNDVITPPPVPRETGVRQSPPPPPGTSESPLAVPVPSSFPPPLPAQQSAARVDQAPWPARQPPPQAHARPPAKSDEGNPLAVAGLVCSLVGLFIFGVLCLLGVILSAAAMSRPQGRGTAMAGLIIGIVGVLLWLLAIMVIYGR